MTPFLIGLAITAGIIAFAELFRNIDLRFYAAINLAAIPFIYIGFSVEPRALVLTAPAALFFLFLAYWGYRKYPILIILGLALHGIWDILFPHASDVAPNGYDVFCITIDLLLAAYFYLKLRAMNKKAAGPMQSA